MYKDDEIEFVLPEFEDEHLEDELFFLNGEME